MQKLTATDTGIGARWGAPHTLITTALEMTTAEIASAIGASLRTVRAWTAGTRKPSERNRVALLALVVKAHREHSAAGPRWVASRDRALCQVKLSLQTAAQQAELAAWSAKINAQFAAPAAHEDREPADGLFAFMSV
jgi:hypothetical protein